MLNVYFGDLPDAIYDTDTYFNFTYDDDWLLSDFAREVIRKVDKSEVLDRGAVQSPVFGIIPPERLSGGTKTLLLIWNCPDIVCNASTCGDNCAPFILKMARKKDITINLRHIMNFGREAFTAHILNDDTDVSGMEEFLFAAAKYV